MKRGQIIIPKSKLDRNLEAAATIKAEMTELLRDLEEKALGQKIDKVGQWRHDPLGWLQRSK